jgi:uncharacterized protein YgiM (DUF1202 family)
MRLSSRLSILTLSVFLVYSICFAEGQGDIVPNVESAPQKYLFEGEVNADGVNIRSDSTTSADIICTADKGERVVVLSKLYEWYKVKLPRNSPAFINKDFVILGEDNTGRILKDNVNVRLRPDTSSPILGRVGLDQAVNILGEAEAWYRIEPPENSFGWIHQTFVNKAPEKKVKLAAQKKKEAPLEVITAEGILRTKTITRIATHKLIGQDNRIYLLKSRGENLDSFNNRKIKVTGKLENPAAKNPIIDVEKIEALD